MKKKGFTLVELLAVIAILAILVILALPNVIGLYNSAKQESFITEVKSLASSAEKQYMSNQVKGDNNRTFSSDGNKLDMTGKELQYCIVLDNTGRVSDMKVSNGIYIASISGGNDVNDLTKDDLVEGNLDDFECTLDNLQGNIAKNVLLKKVITYDGVDGFYEDPYESSRYIFGGSNVDNYIYVGNDLYRIVALETDGTLKVIKNESLDEDSTPMYDNKSRYSENSDDFCNTWSSNLFCSIWGSKTTMLDSTGKNIDKIGSLVYQDSQEIIDKNNLKNLPDEESSLNTYLNTTWYNSLENYAKDVISNHLFNVSYGLYSVDDINRWIEAEKTYKWRGYVGLLTATDYAKANSNSECLTMRPNTSCNTSNWLYNITANWILLQNMYYNNALFSVSKDYGGDGNVYSNDAQIYGDVFPVMYLKSSIELTGDGTFETPYRIM